MKLLLISLLLISSNLALANQPICSPDWQAIAQRLDLDDEQTQAFIDIMTAQRAKRLELRSQNRAAMKALHQDGIEQLQNVLSEDQLMEFKRKINRMQERMVKHQRHGCKLKKSEQEEAAPI